LERRIEAHHYQALSYFYFILHQFIAGLLYTAAFCSASCQCIENEVSSDDLGVMRIGLEDAVEITTGIQAH